MILGGRGQKDMSVMWEREQNIGAYMWGMWKKERRGREKLIRDNKENKEEKERKKNGWREWKLRVKRKYGEGERGRVWVGMERQ